MVDRLFKRGERESTVLYSVQLLWFATFLHVFFHDLTHSQTHIDLSGRGGQGVQSIRVCAEARGGLSSQSKKKDTNS